MVFIDREVQPKQIANMTRQYFERKRERERERGRESEKVCYNSLDTKNTILIE